MSLEPGYGETPLGDDELEDLLPEIRADLGDPVSRADIYDLEQALQDVAATEMLMDALSGKLTLDEMLRDDFLRGLHRRLYARIWLWGGRTRQREINIGVAPEQIAVELRNALETIRYRWDHTNDWSSRELGIAVHAETVRIHPFKDGNGRTTRLLADLVFAAAQQGDAPEQFDWEVDKGEYISLLRRYDVSRDPRPLAAFIPVRPLSDA